MLKKYLYSIFILLVLIISAEQSFGEEKKLLKEEVFENLNGRNLHIDAEAGADVVVNTWDESSAKVKIYGNKNAEKKLKYSFKQTDNGVEIYLRRKESGGFNLFSGVSAKIEVYIPKNFDVTAKTSGGDVKVDDLKGGVKLSTSGGDIEVGVINGPIKCVTSGGDIKVKDSRGKISLSTSGGDIEVKESEGVVEASTSGGDIFLDYSGEFKGINLSSSGGDIKVTLPSGVKADVELKTSGGDVECDLPVSKSKKISSTKFSAEVNGGGLQFNASTSGGDIIVNGL